MAEKFEFEIVVDSKTGEARIKSFGKTYDKSMKDTEKANKRAEKSTKQLGNVYKTVMGAAAVGMIVKFAKSSIDAAMKQEEAEKRLQAAMQQTGNYSKQNFEAMKLMASGFQQASRYGDELIMDSQALGMRLGIQAKDMKRSTQAAMDLAAATGMDLKQAMTLVGKAAAGETGSLSRYGIVLDKNIPKTEKFEAVLGKLNEQFGGAAKADLNTWSGQMTAFKNSLGDLQEVIGAEFMPALTFWLNQLNVLIDEIKQIQGANLTESQKELRNLYTKQGELETDIQTKEWFKNLPAYQKPLTAARYATHPWMLTSMEDLVSQKQEVDNAIKNMEEYMKRTGQSAMPGVGAGMPPMPPMPPKPPGGGGTGGATGWGLSDEEFALWFLQRTNPELYDTVMARQEQALRASQVNIDFSALPVLDPTQDIAENEPELQRLSEHFTKMKKDAEEMKVAIAEWENLLAPFGDYLGDTIMQGLETGNWAFEDMIENWKNLILQQIVNNAIGALIGALSGGLASSNSGVFSFLGTLLGGGQNARNPMGLNNPFIQPQGGGNSVTIIGDVYDANVLANKIGRIQKQRQGRRM